MGSTARKTRNYKEKNSMLAFGHIALPLAAVIALGLLFIGIKLFFLSPAERDVVEVVPQARVETPVAQPETSTLSDTTASVPENGGNAEAPGNQQNSAGNVVLAGPIAQDDDNATAPADTSQTTANTSRPTPSVNTPSGQTGSGSQASSGRALTSKYGVQIGAFVRAEGAQEVVDEVTKQGYVAAVSPIASSGKTYHRVRVAAGNTKEEADRLAAELKKKGYPVLVVANP